MNTKIIVTGALGQLGRALEEATRSASAGFEWVFTDVARLDITDERAVAAFFDTHRPSAVVNCAAWTDVDGAEDHPTAAFLINSDGARIIAAASLRANAALVHISTDFVFDGLPPHEAHRLPDPVRKPYTESDPPNPLNVYGASKLSGERAVLESGCRGVIIRTSWLYSPWGRNFVRSILSAASKKEELRVVDDQCGSPTSAHSLATAVIKILPTLIDGTEPAPSTAPRPAEIYNFCDTGVVSRAGFAAEIIRQAGLKTHIIPVSSSEFYHNQNLSPPAKRPAYSALATSKITKDFGIIPPPWQQQLSLVIRNS